ncbi:hypothetical protein SVIOM74S_00009 [Streptomyces violarus]
MLGLQLRDQPLDGVRMPLTGVLGDDVPLGVDHDERRPGAHGVLLPRGQLRVVEHRVLHAVPLHGVDDRLVLGLVHELRRVHPDHHDRVPVLVLQLAQLVQDVEAVHATKGPKINNYDPAAELRQAGFLVPCVDPATLADELGSTDACAL